MNQRIDQKITKGDHSHESSDIFGLNKIGGMISGFAKTPIGNALLPGVGPALSIAETLMGRGKPKAREQQGSRIKIMDRREMGSNQKCFYWKGITKEGCRTATATRGKRKNPPYYN